VRGKADAAKVWTGSGKIVGIAPPPVQKARIDGDDSGGDRIRRFGFRAHSIPASVHERNRRDQKRLSPSCR